MNDNSALIQEIEDEFAKIVDRLQRQVLSIAISGILGFAIKKGVTSLTTGNIRVNNRIGLRIRAYGRRNRKSTLQYLVGSLLDLFGRNESFYSNEGATQSIDDAARKRILLLYGYDVDKKEVVEGGYLDQLASFNGIAQQVGSLLNQQIATRSSLPSMRRALREQMGRGKQGIVEKHFNRFTRDLFAEFDRTVKLEHKERRGLKYAIYAGTEIKTTRDFCDRRINNVYTETEILKWNNQEWKGKKPGDVRVNCGGYNCRHHLNYVSKGTALVVAEDQGGLNNYN